MPARANARPTPARKAQAKTDRTIVHLAGYSTDDVSESVNA
jgi:hypothetical protein